jgi:GNAT superfamily N-acetyltransferase
MTAATGASFRVESAGASHLAELCALFERAGSACHCEWWHFQGDKNAWLDRLAHRPLENREALARRLRESAEPHHPHGMIALEDSGKAIGWMKLTPCGRVHKLYDQRLYRGLPCFGAGGDRSKVLSIGCFLVDEAYRRRGVASALLRAAIGHARALGARAIEAFPRAGSDLRDEEVWTGPEALFLGHGFEIAPDAKSYPVWRKRLEP